MVLAILISPISESSPSVIPIAPLGVVILPVIVPPDLDIDALEISRHISLEDAKTKFPQIKMFPLIQSGDVHYIDDFLGVNQFIIEKPTIAELKQAFRSINGRWFKIIPHN